MVSTISLPRVHLSSQEKDLDLVLQSSLQIQFKEACDTPSTGDELLELATKKYLWIARTGSCHLKLSVLIQGELVSDDARVSKIAEWIQGFEFWDRLGLRLQYCETRFARPPGELSFSIQHPDLSSALVPPADAFTAEFRSVTCTVELSRREDASILDGRRRKRQKCERTTSRDDKEGRKENTEEELYTGLTLEDQKAIEEFMLGLGMDAVVGQGEGVALTKPQHLTESKEICLSEKARRMLEVALRALVLGSGKPLNGIRVRGAISSHALMRLAPAVFHIPYLRAVSDQAKFLPVIATSLARMSNAESPSLRQKAASLGDILTTREKGCDAADRLVRGIEQSVWNVLLAAIKKPALQARPKSERLGEEYSQEDSTDLKEGLELPMDKSQIEVPRLVDLEPRIGTQSSMWLDSMAYKQPVVEEDTKLRASMGARQEACEARSSNPHTSYPVASCMAMPTLTPEQTSPWRAFTTPNQAPVPSQTYQPMVLGYSLMGYNHGNRINDAPGIYGYHMPSQLPSESYHHWTPNPSISGAHHQLLNGFEARTAMSTVMAQNQSFVDPASFSTFEEWLSSE